MTGPAEKKKRNPRNSFVKKPAGSLEARRMAGVVLEVLAGTMTPTGAAEVMSMSVPKYYMVESRALDGIVAACEPRKKGYARTAERELEALKKKYEGLQRECARYQALARVSRRAVGLKSPKHSGAKRDQKGRKKRKPTVRALTLAARLNHPQKEGTVEKHGGRSEAAPAPDKPKVKPAEPQEAGS